MSVVEHPTHDQPQAVDGLQRIFASAGRGLRERMANVERHLELVTAEAGEPLAGLANATVTSGGKRLRPLLVMLAAEAAGGAQATPEGEERLVRAAVAVELVHSATLVHDDLIDGAALRRGHPTVAARAGHRAAVATGDLLFSRAFSELARNQDPAQLQALSDASSALAEGELLQREDAYCARVSVERYLERCALKTAALFEAACRWERSRGPSARGAWRTRWARSRGESGSPSRCWTTCSTSPGRWSGPASRAATTSSRGP